SCSWGARRRPGWWALAARTPSCARSSRSSPRSPQLTREACLRAPRSRTHTHPTMRTIRAGDHGDDVADVQHRLLAIGDAIDGSELGGRYGPSTEAAVRAFQQRRGLLVDGVVGAETWAELVEAGFSFVDRTLYLRNPNLRGDDVRALQRRLSALGFDAGREDGIFGL